jgi:hypothetical protein
MERLPFEPDEDELSEEYTYPRWWEELQDVGMSMRDFV